MVCVVVLGNEATENRKGYALSALKEVRDSQCLTKVRNNMNWQEAEEINQNLLRGSDERALKVLIPIVVGGYALVA